MHIQEDQIFSRLKLEANQPLVVLYLCPLSEMNETSPCMASPLYMCTFKRHRSSLLPACTIYQFVLFLNVLYKLALQICIAVRTEKILEGGFFSVSFLDLSLLTDVINILDGGYCNPNRDMGITRGRVMCQEKKKTTTTDLPHLFLS